MIKFRAPAIFAATIAFIGVAASFAYAMSPSEFFARDRAQNWTGSLYTAHLKPARQQRRGKHTARVNDLPRILKVTRKMGIPDRLAARVCRVESSCKINGRPGPKTRHGRHVGAYQTRPNVAARFGYNRRQHGPLIGEVALHFGAAHLADCYKRARGNEALAARCHVAGPGAIGRRLNAGAERYAQRYTRQVQVAWAGSLR